MEREEEKEEVLGHICMHAHLHLTCTRVQVVHTYTLAYK